MNSLHEYEVFCHFCGVGKKKVKAASFEEAKKIIEDHETIQFDGVIRLTKPCWVDNNISRLINEHEKRTHHSLEYRNWGAE